MLNNSIESYLASPEYVADPYLVYNELRAHHPVYWSDSWGCWLITGYTDIKDALRGKQLSSSKMESFVGQLPEQMHDGLRSFTAYLSMFLGLSDPPNHTRLRRLVTKAFRSRAVEQMRSRVQTIADQLLDRAPRSGEFDIIRDFAYPLPATVISEMLGLPAVDLTQFKKWSDDIVAFIGAPRATEDAARVGQKSMFELIDYLKVPIAERRRQATSDLLGTLVSAEEQGDALSEQELVATCVTLLSGGHETTTHLIGNGVYNLLLHGEQMAQLRSDPGLMGTAVEELLRFDGPVQRTERVAKETINIGDKTIRKGQRVLLMVGSANRDPRQFRDANEIDIRRQPNRHMAFGFGIHSCVGAPLARLEGPIAISTLLRRMPNLQLATSSLTWQDTVAIRGLTALPVFY